MAGGAKSHVWHDRWGLAHDAAEDAAGLAATGRDLRGVIKELREEGLGDDRIVLGGFSMGGGTSLHTVFCHPEGHEDSLLGLGGVFSMSSWVTTQSAMWTTLAQQHEAGGPARFPPALITHGTHDGLISSRWGMDTAEALKAHGVPVEFHLEHGLGHELGGESLERLQGWLTRVLGL